MASLTDLDVQIHDKIIGRVLRILEHRIEEDGAHLHGFKGADVTGADDGFLWVSPTEDVHPRLLHHRKQVRVVLCGGKSWNNNNMAVDDRAEIMLLWGHVKINYT